MDKERRSGRFVQGRYSTVQVTVVCEVIEGTCTPEQATEPGFFLERQDPCSLTCSVVRSKIILQPGCKLVFAGTVKR